MPSWRAASRCSPAADERIAMPFPLPAPVKPCVECGDCVRVCPELIAPQRIYHALRDEEFALATELGISRCTECGLCDPVCPSAIPLQEFLAQGKAEIVRRGLAQQRADLLRDRYQARQRRLAREFEERAAEERRRKTMSADAVAEAIARAKARRLAEKSGNKSES